MRNPEIREIRKSMMETLWEEVSIQNDGERISQPTPTVVALLSRSQPLDPPVSGYLYPIIRLAEHPHGTSKRVGKKGGSQQVFIIRSTVDPGAAPTDPFSTRSIDS